MTINPITLAHVSDLKQWVAWQIEDRKETGKPTKVPYVSARRSAQSDRGPWITRAEAELVAPALPKPYGVGGIGIMLGELGDGRSIGGVDVDSCRDPATGNIEPWALPVIERFATSTEISPSRTGVKLTFLYTPETLNAIRQAVPNLNTGKQYKRSDGDHPPGFEIYFTHRFWTVTDQPQDGTAPEINQIDESTLLWFLREAGPAYKGETKQAGAGASGHDQSRSAVAFRKGTILIRAGKTYDEMVTALRDDPETAEWCMDKGDARQFDRIHEKALAGLNVDGFELTEDGIAQAFTKRHADSLRYCHHTGAWFHWTGKLWQKDETRLGFDWARMTCRTLAAKAADNKRATLARAATASAVEKFGQADPALRVTSSIWDADPFLLGTPGGTVDLRTGDLRPGSPEDYITKQTAVAPAAVPETPLWDAFLWQATGGDANLIRFLRQWFGYCLTGDTREHALLFGYGPGGNGKSVLLNTAASILGDYCRQSAMETFTASTGDRHPTDLAMLHGARMVCASETEEGRAWAESRIKQMTGGDMIAARFMRRDFFEYRPQFKLVVVGNHKPVLKNIDEAARRRFNVVPFLHTPAEPDRQLETKLRGEWPGILRWMIEGCLDWQRNGLVRPQVVLDATAEYFTAQDYFGRWLADCAKLDAQLESKPSVLLASFRDWCGQNGEPLTDNRTMRGMIERTPGLRYKTVKGLQWVVGIGLTPTPQQGGGVEGGGG